MTEKTVVTVGDFEGPLDLLLSLIAKNKIDIYDVSIAEIADQYLAVIHGWQTLNMDVASDFIVMASRLLEIKSYRLLPKHAQLQTEEAEDPEAKLIRELQTYQMFKAASRYFKARFSLNAGTITRDPAADMTADDKMSVEVDAAELAETYEKIIRRFNENHAFRDEPEAAVAKEAYSVRTQRERIITLLKERNTMYFSHVIFDHNANEVVASFLALLDLAKDHQVSVRQAMAFDRISIKKVDET